MRRCNNVTTKTLSHCENSPKVEIRFVTVLATHDATKSTNCSLRPWTIIETEHQLESCRQSDRSSRLHTIGCGSLWHISPASQDCMQVHITDALQLVDCHRVSSTYLNELLHYPRLAVCFVKFENGNMRLIANEPTVQ